jgi:hypothetical protein
MNISVSQQKCTDRVVIHSTDVVADLEHLLKLATPTHAQSMLAFMKEWSGVS